MIESIVFIWIIKNYIYNLKEILLDFFSLIIVWVGFAVIMFPYSENSMVTVALILIINLVLHKLISIQIEKSYMEISDAVIEKGYMKISDAVIEKKKSIESIK